MANNRKVVINVHSSENRAPSGSTLNYGEIAVSHSSKENAALYTKISDNEVAKFISEDAINSRISGYTDGKFGGLAEIVQDLANLTITDIQATTPINATEKAIVASSCGNTVTISHVADKTEQSGFKKLTTDTYGHVTGGENVVIGDISGLDGFDEAIKGAETKLAYSSAGTGNAVTSISVNDHTITANFGKKFSEDGHKHSGSDITSGKVGIDYLPTSSAVTSSSNNTTIPTSKAVYDAVSGVVNGLDKTASSAQGQFVRTVIQENGLVSESKDFINVNDVKLSAVTPSSTTVKEEYALYNGNGAKLGDSIKIYKDQSLVSITLEDNDGSGKTGQYLKYTYIDVNGVTQSTYVNISSLLAEAEFKSGVTADSNGIVHGVVDSASEKFLTVGANGFKLSGVQDAINSAMGGVDTKLQELSGSVKTLSSTTESFSAATVAGITGLDTKIGEETARATAAENSISGAVNTLSAATESFSAATVAEIARVEGKLSDDEKVIAESINQLGAKVDKTQKGAGLNEDGSYAPHNTANYIAGATSLDDADIKLDSALKAESDRAAAADQTLQANIDKKVSKDDGTWMENFMPRIMLNGNGTTSAPTVGDNLVSDYEDTSYYLGRYGGVVTPFDNRRVHGRVIQVKKSNDNKLYVSAIFNNGADFSDNYANSLYEIVLNFAADGSFANGTYTVKPLGGVFTINLSGDGSTEKPYVVDKTRDEVAAALAANSPILLKGGAADFPGYSEIYTLNWATDYPSQFIVLQFGNIDKESLTYTTMVLAFSHQDSSVSVKASSTQLATSGQVQTLSGSVVSIKNREQNYASAITINGHTHTVVNNSVDLGSFLSANTAHIKTIQQVSTASAVTTTINYVTENGSASAATITQDLIIDCGTY